jgi:similar to stage IV sporulation protein
MQYQWLKWINGYLVIKIKGKRIERFINRAIQKRMVIWNIVRQDELQGKMLIRLEDFFRIKPLLKETNCRVEILSKHGFPFFLRKVKYRYAFFAGFFLFISMLFVLSHMIWSVEVIGTEKISKNDVLTVAQQVGVEQGKFSFFLDDPDKISAKLLAKIPNASWVGFQMVGTKAQIRIVEKVIPEKKEISAPRNIVAKKSAVVQKIFATKGKVMVKPNDFVRKGDVLVSGLIGKEDQPQQVAADGKIEGEVWYETEVTVPLQHGQAVFTGASQQNYYLVVGSHQIKVWGFGHEPFKHYEKSDDKQVYHFKSLGLSLGWDIEDEQETKINQVKIAPTEAIAIAKESAKQDIMAKIGKNGYIKEEKVLHQQKENDKVYIKMHIITIEDIAEKQPIALEGD